MDIKWIKMLTGCTVIGVVILVCFVLMLSGAANTSVYGFAVDDSDRLYVGMSEKIHVFENGVLVDKISANTSRSYAFTITVDDQILLSTGTKIFSMDLSGNILDIKEDPGANTFSQLQYRKREYVSKVGDTYRISNMLGWTKITKNGAITVWQNDVLSYAVKLFLTVSVVNIFCLAGWAAVVVNKGKR